MVLSTHIFFLWDFLGFVIYYLYTWVYREVTHNNFFLHWNSEWDVEISLKYTLKFSLQTQSFFFMCSSSERSVNYSTVMVCMLMSSMCEEEQSVVQFLWAKGHNPSEIHRDMCGLYGEDCMNCSNISRWCTFFKVAVPWRKRTIWRRCDGPYNLPHTCHICPYEFHSGYAL